MNSPCQSVRNDLLELQWSSAERQRAQRVVEHLGSCEECRAAAEEYAAVRAALAPAPRAEPEGGWQQFEERLLAKTRRGDRGRSFWKPAIAAGLLIGFTAFNGWLLFKMNAATTVSSPVTGDYYHPTSPTVPSDMSQASVIKAFHTVSEVFDGRANWVMLSDNASDLGLNDEKASTKDLLLLRLVVMRGTTAVSQMHIAVVPGATVRVTVPSANGPELQYVIATDAADWQNVSVSLAVENGKGPAADAGLGSMATTLNIPFGKSTPTGRIATRDGIFDLSMTLEKAPVSGTKT